MEQNIWYAYRHRKSLGEIFYIGIGKTKNYRRAYVKYNRSKLWNNIVNKYGYEVEIIKQNLSKEDASELEIFLISEYGRLDLGTGILANHTDGGDGVFGMIVSEEYKEILRKRMTGEKNHRYGKPCLPHIGLKGDKNYFFGKKGPDGCRAIPVKDLKTLKTFGCIKDAAKEYNIHPCYLSTMLLGKVKNTTPLIYLKDYEESNEKIYDTENSRKTKVKDTETGEIYTIRQAVDKFNLKESTLYKYLNGDRTNKTTLIKI